MVRNRQKAASQSDTSQRNAAMFKRSVNLWRLSVQALCIGIAFSSAWRYFQKQQFVVAGIYVTVALICAPLFWLMFRDKERQRIFEERSTVGRCVHCGYDLAGNESGRCPECGTAACKITVTENR